MPIQEDAARYRSKEQVLYDLSKALQFSPPSLEANRGGRLTGEQVKRLLPRFIRPAILTAICAFGPILIWTWMKAGSDQLSFVSALPALFKELIQMDDLVENHGKIGAAFRIGSIVIPLAVSAFLAMRVPFLLYFDLIEGKVEAREGRVAAREETVNRPNGRDPVEKYFFSLRYLNMPVSLAAYRALEAGSIYIVYLLPRSEVLVSMEPKMENTQERKGEFKPQNIEPPVPTYQKPSQA